MKQIKVTIWNEFRHEQNDPQVQAIYPLGIHQELATQLGVNTDFDITTATLDQPEHGLTNEVLDKTDVLVWWGHKAHQEVSDVVVERVFARVMNGMGLIVLHSGHDSKIFHKLCGTSSGMLKWRAEGDKERLWVIDHSHPITRGIHEYIELPQEEMYGEYFNIPAPDELLFISWFQGGEVFRSGVTYRRGLGKLFYFRPGHERYPTYKNQQIIQVLANAIRWAVPFDGQMPITGNTRPLETK